MKIETEHSLENQEDKNCRGFPSQVGSLTKLRHQLQNFRLQVWDIDLQRHESTIKDIILVAQGEMALEEFLKQVKETWNTYELDLINYQE